MAPETYRCEEMEHHRSDYSSSSRQHKQRNRKSHDNISDDDYQQHNNKQHTSSKKSLHNNHRHHHNGITHISANSPDAKALISRDEEWTTSKRIVNHKTRQVETRVQRQLVMEDGKVIADSGPQVITRIKEDNHTEEKENDKKPPPMKVPDGYVPVEGPHGRVLGEKKEIQRVSREIREENMQYHDERIKELTGHDVHRRALTAPNELITITDKKHDDYYYRKHGSRNERRSDDDDDDSVVEYPTNNNGGSKLFSRPPRGKMVHYSAKSKKLQDSDEIHEISKLALDGSVTKEVKRTKHHEEFSDDEQPEDERTSEQLRNLPAATKTTQRHFEYLNDFSSSDSDSSQSDKASDNEKKKTTNRHQHRSPSASGRQMTGTTVSTSHEGHVKHHKTRKEKAFPRYTIEPLIDHSYPQPINTDNDSYRRDASTKWIKHTFEKTDRDYDYDDDRRDYQQSLSRRHHSPSKSASPSHRTPVPVPDEYKISKQDKRASSHHQHETSTTRSHTNRADKSARYISPEPVRSHSPTKSHLSHVSHRTANSYRSTGAPKEDASVQATLTDEEDNIERRSLRSQSSTSEHSHHKSTMSLKHQSTPKSQRNYYFGEPSGMDQTKTKHRHNNEDFSDNDIRDVDLDADRKYRTTPSPSKLASGRHRLTPDTHHHTTSRPSSRHSEQKSPDNQIYSLSNRNKKHHTNLVLDDAPSPTPTTSGGSIKNVKTTTTTLSAKLEPRQEELSSDSESSVDRQVRSSSRGGSNKNKDVIVASSSNKNKTTSGSGSNQQTKENDTSKQFSVLFSPTTIKTEYKPNEAIAKAAPSQQHNINVTNHTNKHNITDPQSGKLRKEVLNLKQKMADITSSNHYENYKQHPQRTTTNVIDVQALPVSEARKEIYRHQSLDNHQYKPSGMSTTNTNSAASVITVPSEKLNADIDVEDVLREANSDISSVVDSGNRINQMRMRRQRMPVEKEAVTESTTNKTDSTEKTMDSNTTDNEYAGNMTTTNRAKINQQDNSFPLPDSAPIQNQSIVIPLTNKSYKNTDDSPSNNNNATKITEVDDGPKKRAEDEDLNVAKGGQSYFLDLGTNKMLKSPSVDGEPTLLTRRQRLYYGSPTLSSSYKTSNYQPMATTVSSSRGPLSSILSSIENSRNRYPKTESYFGQSSSGSSPYGGSSNYKRTRSRSSLSPLTTSPALKASRYSIYGGYKKSLYDRPSQHVPRLSYSRAIGPQKGEDKPKTPSRFLKLK